MKVDIEEVESLLLEKKITDPAKVQEIIRDLIKAAEEVKADNAAEAGPKAKWEHIIVLEDKDGVLKGKEIAGWVVQQQDGQNADLIFGKLQDAAIQQNESAKRKKKRFDTFRDIFGHVKPKFLKEKGLRIKTKNLTRVLITDGNIRAGAPAQKTDE
jgi:hypothetical protein